MRRLIVIVLTLVTVTVACGSDKPVASRPLPTETSSSPAPNEIPPGEFDGVIHGWRIARHEVLQQEFGDDERNLQLDCEEQKVGSETATDLDINVSYFPKSVTIVGTPVVVKWVCDKIGLSVYQNYNLEDTPYETLGGAGEIRLERFLMGRRAYELFVPAAAVSACTVAGSPAICVRRNDDEGEADIVVIEDDTLDPHATLLLVSAYGVPFEELVKMIEGIS
jgi:hypothetical protein